MSKWEISKKILDVFKKDWYATRHELKILLWNSSQIHSMIDSLQKTWHKIFRNNDSEWVARSYEYKWYEKPFYLKTRYIEKHNPFIKKIILFLYKFTKWTK
jgi:hypothetical protein